MVKWSCRSEKEWVLVCMEMWELGLERGGRKRERGRDNGDCTSPSNSPAYVLHNKILFF